MCKVAIIDGFYTFTLAVALAKLSEHTSLRITCVTGSDSIAVTIPR